MHVESGHRITPRSRRDVVPLVVIAVVLDLAGGLVPGIDHQVRLGLLPETFDPEPVLGPPFIGSVSGMFAAQGAMVWALIAMPGVLLRSRSRPAALVLLGLATFVTAVINVFLPLQLGNVGWSPLGALQTIATVAALARLSWPRRHADGCQSEVIGGMPNFGEREP